ncbi:MAG: DUF309 domain-containing protein [Candidatus Binatia bacterium]
MAPDIPVDDLVQAGIAHGIALFNAGDFFEAHDAFEEQLEGAESDERWELLLGLIRVAVAYHKLASGHAGSARMLELGLETLAPFPEATRGIAVERLRARVREDLATLQAGRDAADRLAADPPQIEPAA